MSKVPAEYEETPTLQNFSPTVSSGFTLVEAKYKYLDKNTIYFIISLNQTSPAALTGQALCTFPNTLMPIITSPITSMVLDSNYVLSSQSYGSLSASDGSLRIRTTTTCKYIYATGIIVRG